MRSPVRFAGVIVSADTAASESTRYGWPAEHELLLYVIHGVLHLVGYDDKSEATTARMRQAESEQLAKFGLTAPWSNESPDAEASSLRLSGDP